MVKLLITTKEDKQLLMDYNGSDEEQRIKFNNALKTGFIKDYEIYNESE
jgi:hypothetical protein